MVGKGRLAVVTVLVWLIAAEVMAQFWYTTYGRAPLAIDSSRVTLRVDDTVSVGSRDGLILSLDGIVQILDDTRVLDGFVTCSLKTALGYNAFLNSLKQVQGVELVEPYYLDQHGTPKLMGERFCVGFRKAISLKRIKTIVASYNLVLDREILPNVFAVRNTDSSGHGLLELANMFHEMPETRYAQPNFRAETEMDGEPYRLFDHYHEYQDHIKKVIGDFNNASVWDFAGLDRSITVAVIDDGIAEHEDLPAERILPGYDFADKDSNTVPPPHRAHGIACVGIIGASHTTDSLQGLCPPTGICFDES